MPKITIFEKDVSTPSISDIDSNITYIPGYAAMGPINTPILCESVSDFEKIFGKTPYVFRETQKFPVHDVSNHVSGFTDDAKSSEYFSLCGDLESSYTYAKDILKAGLPILFERVFNKTNINAWTAKKELPFDNGTLTPSTSDALVISSKEPGASGLAVAYKIEKTAVAGEYKLYINGNTTVTFSLDVANTKYFERLDFADVTLSVKGTLPVTNAAIYMPANTTELTGNLEITDTSVYVDTTKTGTLNNLKDEFTVRDFYDSLANTDLFTKLVDKGVYQIKFITSGSYPVFEYTNEVAVDTNYTSVKNAIVNNMLEAAGLRGDAIALIDHTNNLSRDLVGDNTNSLYKSLQEFNNKTAKVVGEGALQETAEKYGAMFTPWAVYQSSTLSTDVIMPASYAYLTSLAKSVRTSANWYAIAGVTRGAVSNLLQVNQVITGAIADELQQETGISINPIVNIKPYGYCIWGNRTMHRASESDGLTASSFLNIRMLSNDVKKSVYLAAKKLTFELNSDILWLNFRSEIEPMLDKMVSGNGLTGYKIIKKTSTKRATIEAVIRLYAVEAVENWDITVELSDTYVSVQ